MYAHSMANPSPYAVPVFSHHVGSWVPCHVLSLPAFATVAEEVAVYLELLPCVTGGEVRLGVDLPFVFSDEGPSFQGMYIFLHTVKGTPFETPDQGKARLLTHWEQMDYGVQFTASRKFLTITPIVL